MNRDRRNFLHSALAITAASVVPARTWAGAYPAHAVRIVVGYAPGGSNDIYARLISQSLSGKLGQSFVVENRPGAGSNIATEAVVKAAADGYTLLLINPANAINASLYDKLSFMFLRDITPVAAMIRQPLVMLVNPKIPARTVAEFVAHTRTGSGTVAMASAGRGSAPHLAGELFRMMSGADLITLHYRGAGPAIADLLSGQVQLYFAGVASAIGHVRSGRLRALGVTTATPCDALPDLPIIGDCVPGFEASDWFGLGAPAGTTDRIIELLNNQVNASLSDPAFRSRVSELGGTIVGGSPAAFGAFIASETEKWANVIRSASIKPE